MLTKTPEAVQEHDRCHAMITVETPDVSGQLRLTKITHEAAPAYGRGHAMRGGPAALDCAPGARFGPKGF